MPVSFVTAFYKLTTGSRRSVETYFSDFEKLASLGIPIFLYLDVAFKEKGTELCKKYPNVVIPRFVTLDKSWAARPAYYLPQKRNVEKDSEDYFFVQLSKLAIMTEAALIVPNSHLAWIDFGIFHMFKDVEFAKMCLLRIHYSNFPEKKIFAPGCWFRDWETASKYDRWNVTIWRFCGSLLVGHKDLFAAAYESQTILVKKYLPLLTWEINYWTLMDERFEWSYCDHDESMLYSVCQHRIMKVF